MATIEPKQLAAKMGISPKRLRAMLRAEHPRAAEQKSKKWEISPELAKQVEAEYKAKKAKAEEAKKAEIQKQLAGEAEKPKEEPKQQPKPQPQPKK